MTTTPARRPPARPVVTIPTQPRPAPPDWRNVFLEPAYNDGRPYTDPHADDDQDDDGHNRTL